MGSVPRTDAEPAEPRLPLGRRLLWKDWIALARSAFTNWGDHRCSAMAASLAFYAAFSLAPVLVIIIELGGVFYGVDATEGRLYHHIAGVVGSDAATAVQAMVANATRARSGPLSTGLSIIAIIAGASATFTELIVALNVIWGAVTGSDRAGWRRMVRVRLVSFSVVVGIAFLLILLLVFDTAASVAIANMWPIDSGTQMVASIVQKLIGIIFLAVGFAALLKVLPDAHVRYQEVAMGAAASALLFVGGRGLFGLYLSHAGTANAFGAAGALAVLLMWLFYSASVFLFGAELAAARWAVVRSRRAAKEMLGQDTTVIAANDDAHRPRPPAPN